MMEQDLFIKFMRDDNGSHWKALVEKLEKTLHSLLSVLVIAVKLDRRVQMLVVCVRPALPSEMK